MSEVWTGDDPGLSIEEKNVAPWDPKRVMGDFVPSPGTPVFPEYPGTHLAEPVEGLTDVAVLDSTDPIASFEERQGDK